MDGKFLNVYNEVILENFNAVLKQNFMFQTQIKFLEEKVKEVDKLQKELDDLKASNTNVQALLVEIESLKSDINGKNALLQSSKSDDAERVRLQNAVNSQMKEIASLKANLETLENDKKEQQDYINQLEDMLPNSKKKKLGITVVEEEKPAIKEEKQPEPKADILKFASSGGTF